MLIWRSKFSLSLSKLASWIFFSSELSDQRLKQLYMYNLTFNRLVTPKWLNRKACVVKWFYQSLGLVSTLFPTLALKYFTRSIYIFFLLNFELEWNSLSLSFSLPLSPECLSAVS